MVFPESRGKEQGPRESEMSQGGSISPSLKWGMRHANGDDVFEGGEPKEAILIWLPFYMGYGMVGIC